MSAPVLAEEMLDDPPLGWRQWMCQQDERGMTMTAVRGDAVAFIQTEDTVIHVQKDTK